MLNILQNVPLKDTKKEKEKEKNIRMQNPDKVI